MATKQLTNCGHSKALIIDRSLLQEAKIDESTPFNISVNPNGGITIQSVKPLEKHLINQAAMDILEQRRALFESLSCK